MVKVKSILACLYLVVLVSFIDSATKNNDSKTILKATAWLSLQFILGFLAIVVFFYLLNIFLFY